MTDNLATPEMEADVSEENTEATETPALTEGNLLASLEERFASEEDLDTQEAEEEGGEEIDEQVEAGEDEVEAEEDVEDQEEVSYEVTLPGGEVTTVSETELKRGYSREADYTQKTMKLAEQRKALEAEQTQITELRTRLSTNLDGFLSERERVLKEAENVDWINLHREDPDKAAELKIRVDATRAEFDKAKQAQSKLNEESKAEQRQKYAEYLNDQHSKLIEKRPIFNDAKKSSSIWDKVNNELKFRGFTEQEISSVSDARSIDILIDAMAYRELQGKKPQVIKKGKKLPKFQKTGARVSKKTVNEATKTRDMSAVKSGSMSVEDYILNNINI